MRTASAYSGSRVRPIISDLILRLQGTPGRPCRDRGRSGLTEITRALTDAEQAIFEEQENLCCYAKGNKTWASDPDGVVWETFHRLGHSETMGRDEARDSQIEDLHERAVI